MTVGRSTPGGDAIGVLSLDQEPSDDSLSKVRTCEGIHSAKVCKLPIAGQLPYLLAAGSNSSDGR